MGNERKVAKIETEIEAVSPTTFLIRVKRRFAISRIYYPGVGSDERLEHSSVYIPSEILYLDTLKDGLTPPDHSFIKGDMFYSPVKTDVMDAVFIQDTHPNKEALAEILRVLKPEGIIIFSLDDCVGGNKNDLKMLQRSKELTQPQLPYRTSLYRVFQKRSPVEHTSNKLLDLFHILLPGVFFQTNKSRNIDKRTT